MRRSSLVYRRAFLRASIVGELKHIITKGVSTEGAPLMNSMLNDVIYTLLDARENGGDVTFLDIHDFLVFASRREQILRFVKSERYTERWNVMPTDKERQPMVSRMNDFVSSAYLRKILRCPKPDLSIDWVMQNRKILILNLGGTDEPSSLFATLVIAKIHQLMKRRGLRNIAEDQRIPFHLYVDEFGFFQTSEFAEMLSFDGGFGLRLVLANQYQEQIKNVWAAVKGNVDSSIIFKLSPEDAKSYSHLTKNYFGEKADLDLSQIPKHTAFYAISGQRPIHKQTKPPLELPEVSHAEYIKKRTMQLFACQSMPVFHTSKHDYVQPGTKEIRYGFAPSDKADPNPRRDPDPQPPSRVPVSDPPPPRGAKRHVPPRRTEKSEPPLPSKKN